MSQKRYVHRSIKGWLGAVVITVLAGAACATDGGLQNDGPVVKDLEINGADAVDPGDIKDQILTQETSWIPFTKKKRLDLNIWRQDLKRIERYYQARGYYQAEVLSSDIEPAGEGKVEIAVEVKEGEPTRITEVTVTGLEGLPKEHQREVMRVIDLSKGEIFEETRWSELPERVKEKLISLGYAEADIEADARVDLAQQTAALALVAAPGARYRIGEVQVQQPGQARVETWRIREQAQEALETEAYYSQDARLEVQQRVFEMGVFGAVQVLPGPGDPEQGRIPLTVEVSEAPFHELAYGFGFGFEQRRQEGHVLTEYTHRDFLGGLRQLQLKALAGWAFIPNIYTASAGGDAVTQSGPIVQLSAELEQPRLFHPNISLFTRATVERELEQAYSYNGGSAHVGVRWRPRSWFIIEPSYNFEVYRLTAGTTSLTTDAPRLLFGCEEICILSYLEQRFAYDRRDDPQDPKEGFYLALALQEGGGPLGGSFDYLRVVPEARGYVSFLSDRKLTVAGRLRVGTLIPIGADDLESPVVARFFSGGDNMRGFSTQRLSPMRLVEKDSPEGEYDAEPMPIGGNGVFEASLELRYDLTQAITVATFVDAGFVTTENLELGRPGYFARNMLYAVGAGVRYQTPVGPVRLDLAYRLPIGPPLRVYDAPGRDLDYLPSEGCFGLGRTSDMRGGAPESVCAIHLSIGEAF